MFISIKSEILIFNHVRWSVFAKYSGGHFNLITQVHLPNWADTSQALLCQPLSSQIFCVSVAFSAFMVALRLKYVHFVIINCNYLILDCSNETVCSKSNMSCLMPKPLHWSVHIDILCFQLIRVLHFVPTFFISGILQEFQTFDHWTYVY
jgi:hypothetical protein